MYFSAFWGKKWLLVSRSSTQQLPIVKVKQSSTKLSHKFGKLVCRDPCAILYITQIRILYLHITQIRILYLRKDLYLRIGRNFWAEKVLCCILGRCATAGGVTLRLPSLGLARKINYNWSVFAALEFRICIYIWTCICICILLWWPSVGLAGSLVYYHYPLLTIPIRYLWI